jgi:hypothetical protein
MPKTTQAIESPHKSIAVACFKAAWIARKLPQKNLGTLMRVQDYALCAADGFAPFMAESKLTDMTFAMRHYLLSLGNSSALTAQLVDCGFLSKNEGMDISNLFDAPQA